MEFEQTPGDSEGQGSLACCSSWSHKELDMTFSLNNKEIIYIMFKHRLNQSIVIGLVFDGRSRGLGVDID